MTVAPHWEHFEHMADMGVRGFGHTLVEAFEQAALAMTAIITDPALVDSREQVVIRCEESDPELMLADWLNSLVFEMACRKMLFNRFEIQIVGDTLEAKVWGESVNVRRHQPAVEVKGATYTELKVYQRADGAYIAQCVVDV